MLEDASDSMMLPFYTTSATSATLSVDSKGAVGLADKQPEKASNSHHHHGHPRSPSKDEDNGADEGDDFQTLKRAVKSSVSSENKNNNSNNLAKVRFGDHDHQHQSRSMPTSRYGKFLFLFS